MTSIDPTIDDTDADVLELIKVTARQVAAGLKGDQKRIEELSLRNVELSDRLTRRLNPYREAVRYKVHDVVEDELIKARRFHERSTHLLGSEDDNLVESVTNAVMDLFNAQSSAGGETT